MRIYDSTTKRVLRNVTLFLTESEAKELADSAADLAQNPNKGHHHVLDAGFRREITVAIYVPGVRKGFDDEAWAVLNSNEDEG